MRTRRAPPARSTARALAEASTEELLDLPLRELPARPEESPVAPALARLAAELGERGLRPLPHVWFSSEWFSPDGVPGIALPFFLVHPRLVALERRLTGQAEGARPADCLRYLRHEAGHALDTAHGLSRRPAWRRAFGARSSPYRRTYAADPGSRAHVLHLPRWYAQSHPAEDFAETFAVWLASGRSRGWRRRHAGTPALGKLEVVDALVGEVAHRAPELRSRERPWSLGRLPGTLREHYARRRRREALHPAPPWERALGRWFEPRGAGRGHGPAAARHLRSLRREVVARLAPPSFREAYSIAQVLDGMIELGLARGLVAPPGPLPDAAAVAREVRRTLSRLAAGTDRLTR